MLAICCEHSKLIFSSNSVGRMVIIDIIVVVYLTINVWSKFHELGFCTVKYDLLNVCAVVHVVFPIYVNAVLTWDAFPMGLVVVGDLSQGFPIREYHSVQDAIYDKTEYD